MNKILHASILAILAAACVGPQPGTDAGPADAHTVPADGGIPDHHSPDAGGTNDVATDDAGDPRGFGAISGPCGVLDDMLLSGAPYFVANAIDFGTDPYDEADYPLLTAGGQEIIDDGNAGGSSIYSEVFAYEVLHRCDGATLLKTETEIVYTNPQGKITDLLVQFDQGLKIGVSVTRAIAWPFEDPYTVPQAQELLEDKLQGVTDSSANVSDQDRWHKQILHVIAYGPGHADAMEQAFAQVDATLKTDTIVYVTVSDGDDAFLY